MASGCLPATSGSTTLAAFACNAYVLSNSQLLYVTQAATAVGPLSSGDGTYWLAIHKDTSTAVGGWTRQTGSHYLWQKNAIEPASPTGGLVFQEVTVAGGAITAVIDKRWRWPLSAPVATPAIICDGTTDTTALIQEAIDVQTTRVPNTISSSKRSKIVELPPGSCRLLSTVTLRDGVSLEGQGTSATELSCAAGITCVTVPDHGGGGEWAIKKMAITGGATAINVLGYNTLFSLQDLLISGQTGTAVQMATTEAWTLDRVFIRNGGGKGLHTGQGTGTPAYNNGITERFSINTLRLSNMAGEGLWLDRLAGQGGPGSGVIINLQTIQMLKQAVRITSSTHITIIGLNTEGCGGSLTNTYDCVLLEGVNNIGTKILSPNIGGTYGTPGVSPGARYGINAIATTGCLIQGGAVGGVYGAAGIIVQQQCDIHGVSSSVIGTSEPGADVYGYLSHWTGRNLTEVTPPTIPTSLSSMPGRGITMFLNDSNSAGSGTVGDFEVRRYDAGRTRLLSVSGTTGAIQLSGTFIGFWDGSSLTFGGGRFFYSAAAPVAGTWARGDHAYNSAPAVGQPIGWICTVAGTPGTWVAMANL